MTETPLETALMKGLKAEKMLYLQAHPNAFEELILLAQGNKQPYAWRAAWLLSNVMKKNDQRLQSHIRAFIAILPNAPEGHKRELLNILRNIEVDEEQEGRLFDHCVTIWENTNQIPSVRHNAFRIIIKIAKNYPELLDEIRFLTQDHYIKPLSDGIKKVIRKKVASLYSKS